jgi:hypothetical protein
MEPWRVGQGTYGFGGVLMALLILLKQKKPSELVIPALPSFRIQVLVQPTGSTPPLPDWRIPPPRSTSPSPSWWYRGRCGCLASGSSLATWRW